MSTFTPTSDYDRSLIWLRASTAAAEKVLAGPSEKLLPLREKAVGAKIKGDEVDRLLNLKAGSLSEYIALYETLFATIAAGEKEIAAADEHINLANYQLASKTITDADKAKYSDMLAKAQQRRKQVLEAQAEHGRRNFSADMCNTVLNVLRVAAASGKSADAELAAVRVLGDMNQLGVAHTPATSHLMRAILFGDAEWEHSGLLFATIESPEVSAVSFGATGALGADVVAATVAAVERRHGVALSERRGGKAAQIDAVCFPRVLPPSMLEPAATPAAAAAAAPAAAAAGGEKKK